MENIPQRGHHANRFLAALEHEDFAALEPNLEVVSLSKGAVVYEAGESIRYTFFPHNAIVSLVEVMEDGRVAEVALFGREGLFGLMSAFISREALGRYVVLVSGTASRIPIEQIHKCIRSRSHLRRLVAAYGEALLAQAFHTVACNAIHTVEERCCRWLLSTHDRTDQDILPLTHETLAEMLGVQRSTISAILRPFQNSGLIEQRRGGIVVTDRAGLERAACECHGKIRARVERLLPGSYTHTDRGRQTSFTEPVQTTPAIKPRR